MAVRLYHPMLLLLLLLLVPAASSDVDTTPKLPKHHALRTVKNADQDQDGHADQDEIHLHLHGDMAKKHSRLQAGAEDMGSSIDSSFVRLDTDRDGVVSKAEAEQAKNSYGHRKLRRACGYMHFAFVC